MLEDIEMRFILTDTEGHLLGCYSELDSAEMDAKDLVESKGEDHSILIYELLTAQKIGEPYLQKIYELRKSIPEAEQEEEEKTADEKEKKD
jgi:hypothetical protein